MINLTKNQAFVLIATGVLLLAFSILKIYQFISSTNSQAPVNQQIYQTETKTPTPAINASESPSTLSSDQIQILEDYLKVNLSLLSPKKEVLGGKFYLTDLKIIDPESAIISYEDGHISFDAKIKFFFINNLPSLHEFTIIGENGQMIITTPTSTIATTSQN